MLLLPVGQEGVATRRWPLVNLAVLTLCLFTAVDGCIVDDQTRYGREQAYLDMGRLVLRIKGTCGEACAELDARDIGAAIRDGELGTEVQQEEFEAIGVKLREIAARTPVQRFGYRPATSVVWTLLTYMFTHGGWMHLIGNMLFLYVVGVALEDRWGHLRYGALFLVSGVLAAVAFGQLHPYSARPLVGASGAIAAIMGAFLVIFGWSRIKFFYWIWIKAGTFSAPAWLVLSLWFLEQLLAVGDEDGSGVAYSAHAVGFGLGATWAGLMRLTGFERRVADRDSSPVRAEDPDLIEAEARAIRGDRAGARAQLEHVLTRTPQHLGAHRLGLRLALQERSPQRVTRHAAVTWPNAEPALLLSQHRALEGLLGESPVDERLLPLVLSAAHAERDREVIQAILRQLYRGAPGSALLPRALWLLADLYDRAGELEMARRLRAKLLADHPDDPWARRARSTA